MSGKSKEDEKSEPAFPLEKILNVTATEYCASVGKKLSDYELKGVHFGSGHHYTNIPEWYVKDFANLVPKNAEVVVNYRIFHSNRALNPAKVTAEGTALIPKKKTSRKK